MKKETKGTILALLAAVVSGIAIPANKLFVVNLDPLVFTAIRALIIGVVFFFIAFYQSRSQHRKFKKVPWKYLLAIAVIGGAAAFFLYFTGLKLTTAGRAAFLYHSVLAISTVIFAGMFLSEKVSRKMAYALLIMLIGTVILYVSQVTYSQLWANPNLGDTLIVIASVLWGIEYVISKRVISMGETNFVVSFARMFFGGLILFGAVIIFGNISSILSLSIQQWVNIIISTLLLFADVLFLYWSMRYINVSKTATLFLVAPVISLIGGIVFLHEPAPLLQIAGSAIILVGAYFVLVVKRANQNKKHKILIFGNPMLKEDSVPLKLMPKLIKKFPDIEFKEFDPNDNLENEGRVLNIIDCVNQIRKVTLITEINLIETAKIYTMHDFDLGYNLKLLKKMNYIDNVRIFGVPMKMKEEEAFNQLVKIISATLS